MGYRKISNNPDVQRQYNKIRGNLARDHRQKGEPADHVSDHRFALMLVAQSPPRANTDREFFEGQGTLEDQFEGDTQGLEACVANAKRHGYNPSPQDVYVPGIARFEGDPEAFVSASGGRSHIKKVCEQRGWSCSGAVNVKGQAPDKDPLTETNIPLGEDIIKKEVAKRKAAGFKGDDRELRDEVIDKHASKL